MWGIVLVGIFVGYVYPVTGSLFCGGLLRLLIRWLNSRVPDGKRVPSPTAMRAFLVGMAFVALDALFLFVIPRLIAAFGIQVPGDEVTLAVLMRCATTPLDFPVMAGLLRFMVPLPPRVAVGMGLVMCVVLIPILNAWLLTGVALAQAVGDSGI